MSLREPHSFHQEAANPVCITFRDLHFGATLRGRAAKTWLEGGGEAADVQDSGPCGGKSCTKPILHGLTGAFRPGTMTAIMGASGAGKTTLLKAIAGEGAEGVLTGDLSVNGQPVTTDDIRRISGFVFQDDLLMATMTVREAILFSARLRLPRSLSLDVKENRVQQVIDLLHLGNCADSLIGSPMLKGGISGGEKKRVAIGMELVTNPSILFLDEPTTGLDTYTAYSVMNTLHSLAAAGRTVVATIHQPSSDIFHLFDNLIVLSQGHIVYQGPAGGMIKFAADIGLTCHAYVNPADFLFMQVLNDATNEIGDEETHKIRDKARTDKLLQAYKSSSVCQAFLGSHMTFNGVPIDLHSRVERPSLLEQMQIIGARNFRNVRRNPLGARAKFLQAAFMGAIVALIFQGMKTNQSSTQDRLGSLFFMAMTMMNGAFSVLSLFAQERTIVEREQALGLYSVTAYFIPKVLTELPQNILGPVVQGTIVFFALGYDKTYINTMAEKFVIFLSVVTLTTNSGNGLGIFIASVFSDLRITLVAAPPMILPLMIFSGFFINTDSIPVYLDWIKYLSPMKYAFQAYCMNEFVGLKLMCDPDEFTASPNCPKENPRCFCPQTTGEEVLKGLGFDENFTAFHNILCLIALFVGFHLLAFFALRRVIVAKESSRTKLQRLDPTYHHPSQTSGVPQPKANGSDAQFYPPGVQSNWTLQQPGQVGQHPGLVQHSGFHR